MVTAVFAGCASDALKECLVKAGLSIKTIIHSGVIHFPAQSDLHGGAVEPSFSDIRHDGHTHCIMEIIIELPDGIMVFLTQIFQRKVFFQIVFNKVQYIVRRHFVSPPFLSITDRAQKSFPKLQSLLDLKGDTKGRAYA